MTVVRRVRDELTFQRLAIKAVGGSSCTREVRRLQDGPRSPFSNPCADQHASITTQCEFISEEGRNCAQAPHIHSADDGHIHLFRKN